MKNIMVAMSGGTTPVINSTLAGIIAAIKKYSQHSKIYVPYPGIVGIFNNGGLYEIDFEKVNRQLVEQLTLTPGSSITGTSRVFKFTETEINHFKFVLSSLEIDAFINIGGSGTIKQSIFFHENIPSVNFISLPKTIDNDLGDSAFQEVAFTPGYLSCLNYISSLTNNLVRENEGAYINERVLVAQVFGRDTSHIAATSAFAENTERVIILFPEKPLTDVQFLEAVRYKINKFGGAVVIVPEGYPMHIFGESMQIQFDESKQIKWTSSSNSISQVIVNYLHRHGISARLNNTTTEQRQSYLHYDINDVEWAFETGYSAIEKILEGQKSFFNSISMVNNHTLKNVQIPLTSISNYERKFPIDWINEDGTFVNEKFITYIKSLNPTFRTVEGNSYLDRLNIVKKCKQQFYCSSTIVLNTL